MTLTFLDLYNECAGQPWSMYDNDVQSSEEFETAMKISINKAVSYLWNLYPWKFRLNNIKIKTKPNKTKYVLPDGTIAKKTIVGTKKHCVRYEGDYLEYAPNYTVLDEEFGEPKEFYVDGDDLYIYPTPDDVYVLSIDYFSAPIGIKEDGTEIYELVDDTDQLNIPEKYETYFKNAVISKAMLYAITDQSDENDSGYREQFNDALNVLRTYCYNDVKERKIII